MDKLRDFKILYVTAVDLSLERGPGINEREFVNELDSTKGVEPYYLIAKPKKPLASISKLSGQVIYCMHNNFYNPFIFILHTISMVCSYLRIKRQRGFDLLVFRLDIFPLAPYLITLFSDTPYSIKTLEYFDYFRYQKGCKGLIGKLFYLPSSLIHKRLVEKAIAVDVCTKQFVNYFNERLNVSSNKFYYIDNAVNLKRFKPMDVKQAKLKTGLNRFNSIVGFVGGRPLERGGIQIIAAASKLVDKHQDIGFVVVGGNKYEIEKLIEIAQSNGTIKYCVFPGQVRYDDVNLYINSFDVCVAFDLSSRTNIFGNASQKIRQYIACGKPVIVGENGSNFIDKEKLGSIVNPNDYDGIAEAMEYWLSISMELKKAHSDKANKFAMENLSTTKAVEKRIDIWRSLI